MLDANSPAALGRMRGLRAAHPPTTLRRCPSLLKWSWRLQPLGTTIGHHKFGPFGTIWNRALLKYEDLVVTQ